MASDGRSFVSGHFAGAVRLWSFPELTCTWTCQIHSGRVRGIIVTPGFLVTCGDDGYIYVLVTCWVMRQDCSLTCAQTPSTGANEKRINLDQAVHRILLVGGQLFAGASNQGVFQFDAASRRCVQAPLFACRDDMYGLVLLPGACRAACLSAHPAQHPGSRSDLLTEVRPVGRVVHFGLAACAPSSLWWPCWSLLQPPGRTS